MLPITIKFSFIGNFHSFNLIVFSIMSFYYYILLLCYYYLSKLIISWVNSLTFLQFCFCFYLFIVKIRIKSTYGGLRA